MDIQRVLEKLQQGRGIRSNPSWNGSNIQNHQELYHQKTPFEAWHSVWECRLNHTSMRQRFRFICKLILGKIQPRWYELLGNLAFPRLQMGQLNDIFPANYRECPRCVQHIRQPYKSYLAASICDVGFTTTTFNCGQGWEWYYICGLPQS